MGEYFALIFISVAAVVALAWLIGGRNIISFGIGAVLGYLLPGIYVSRQQARRLNQFNDQLSDMLNLMVNGLRAGYSTLQAMEAVSKELPSPICDEFRRVVQEMQLGIPMEAALANLLRRIPSDDLDFVITAINVQREVGGNLSEILDTISFTIRERVRIKGEIRVHHIPGPRLGNHPGPDPRLPDRRALVPQPEIPDVVRDAGPFARSSPAWWSLCSSAWVTSS